MRVGAMEGEQAAHRDAFTRMKRPKRILIAFAPEVLEEAEPLTPSSEDKGEAPFDWWDDVEPAIQVGDLVRLHSLTRTDLIGLTGEIITMGPERIGLSVSPAARAPCRPCGESHSLGDIVASGGVRSLNFA